MSIQPVALTIAGSDSSAGAGLQADLKTFAAFDVYGVCAVTCVVSEIPGQVNQLVALHPDIVADQIDLLLSHFPVCALKTGLLPNTGIIQQVRAVLDRHPSRPLVVDPVMVATSGDRLMDGSAGTALEDLLMQRATVVTPNLDEAAVLWGAPILDLPTMHRAGRDLSRRWSNAVLLKGGHLRSTDAVDLLFMQGELVLELSAPFLASVQTHGTGCTLSAAITAGLACGATLETSCREAKQYLHRTLTEHLHWTDAQSGAPLHALHHLVGK